jgi:ribosomal protein S18 acetylase RimI-like enzyme
VTNQVARFSGLGILPEGLFCPKGRPEPGDLSPGEDWKNQEETEMNDEMITVRPVERDDAADLLENCFSMSTLEGVQKRIENTIQMAEEGGGVRLVAEVDGMVVGTVMLSRHTHPFYAHRAKVDDVVVRGEYQWRGIARRLIAECHTHAASMGVEILEIGVRGGTPAEEVYRRLGFIEYARLPEGIKEPGDGGNVFDEIRFYRPVERVE